MYSTCVTEIFLIFYVALLQYSVRADEHEYRLLHSLLRRYDPRIRPSVNASESLNVTFGLALSQIIDVDEKNQIITTNCWLNQAWIDNNLRWDPAKYNGIKVLRIPHKALWKPDILLYNNADVSSYKWSISTNVIVTSDGNVTWLSMMIFRSSCAINVKYFPFDEQNCTMQFASWTYDGFQINLVKVGEEGDLSNYIPNSEWTLVGLHAKRNVVYYSCCAEPYPDITYTIQMRRKPLFYVFNMIMPCFLITLVALLGFYVPADSGEKVSMGITTLLSMTVFLMLVAENMPPTSDVLPLVGLYYGITIAIVSFATAMTVLTLNIHHKGEAGREVPSFVRRICFDVLAKILCIDIRSLDDTLSRRRREDECSCSSCLTRLRRSIGRQRKLRNNEECRAHREFSTYSGSESVNDCLWEYSLPTVVSSPTADMEFKPQVQRQSTILPENGSCQHQYPLPPYYFPSRHRSAHTSGVGGATGDSPISLTPGQIGRMNNHSSTGRSGNDGGVVESATLHPAGLGSTPEVTSNTERQFYRTLVRVERMMESNESRASERDRQTAIKLQWQLVATIVDRALLALFVGTTIGVTMAVLLGAPHARDFLFGTGPGDVLIQTTDSVENASLTSSA